MSKTKAYPLGATDGQRLPDTKLNIIDANAANSLDLSGGGAHTLGANLTLTGDAGGENFTLANIDFILSGGSTFQLSGDAIITGDITGVDNLTASQTVTTQDLHVTDDATIDDDCAVGGDLSAANITTGGTLSGAAISGLTLAITGNASIGGNVTGVDDLTMSGALTVGTSITMNGDLNGVETINADEAVIATTQLEAGTYCAVGTFFEENNQTIASPVATDTGLGYNSVTTGFCHVTGTLTNSDTKDYIFRLPSTTRTGSRVEIHFDNMGPGTRDPGVQIKSYDGADLVWEPSGDLTANQERVSLCFVRVANGTGDFSSDWVWSRQNFPEWNT